MTVELEFAQAPTVEAFMDSTDFIRGIIGPVGSGKSSACCVELMGLATQQKPDRDGVARFRAGIIRNTYRELLDTTIRTWHDWFPVGMGTWSAQNMTHTIQRNSAIYEFAFRALDRPDDIGKLLSLDLTYIWVNEARELPREVIDMAQSRVGRYPSKKNGPGPTRDGLIMDTNPPDSDHWWYELFEETRPDGWSVFHQPSGLSPEGENLENLPEGYYDRLIQGHDQQWIDVYVHGKYGFVKDGLPVYPEYQDPVHSASVELLDAPLVVGIDFGRTPAAVVWQQDPADGQWRAMSELVTFNMGAIKFGDLLRKHMVSNYRGLPVEFWGDPAGEAMTQVEDRTPFDALLSSGINAFPAPSQDPTIRRETVANLLRTLTPMGRPGLVVDPACTQYRKGLAGGHKYRRMQVSGSAVYADKPDKHTKYSHVCEAGEYGLVGAGEDRVAFEVPGHMRRKPRVKRAIGSRHG